MPTLWIYFTCIAQLNTDQSHVIRSHGFSDYPISITPNCNMCIPGNWADHLGKDAGFKRDWALWKSKPIL